MNKLYPWLPAKSISNLYIKSYNTSSSDTTEENNNSIYYFLVTCDTINSTISYKEIEEIVCINKFSRRFLEETDAKFIVYAGSKQEIVLNDVILSFDRYQAIHKVEFLSEHCILGGNDRDVSSFRMNKNVKNWIPYYSEFHDSLNSIDYACSSDYARASERHVVINDEFITSYSSEGNSNEGFQNYALFKLPTHINKDESMFLYTPHQIYNLYINFIMTKEEIQDFIYKLEKARILNVIPISVV